MPQVGILFALSEMEKHVWCHTYKHFPWEGGKRLEQLEPGPELCPGWEEGCSEGKGSGWGFRTLLTPSHKRTRASRWRRPAGWPVLLVLHSDCQVLNPKGAPENCPV